MGSKHNGRKRRFASRHIQDAECFRIPENPKIFVSVAIENAFFTKRIVSLDYLNLPPSQAGSEAGGPGGTNGRGIKGE
jgi:hypothetical protein